MSEEYAQPLHRVVAAACTLKARNTGSPKAWPEMTNRTPARTGRAPWGGGEVRSTLKPVNAGGGKGPQFKTDAGRGEGPGDWSSLSTPRVFKESQMASHANEAWCLVREPDAGDLHVRFDERDVETESGLNQ